MSSEKDEALNNLETLVAPAQHEGEYGGKKLTLKPIKVGQVAKVLRIGKPLLERLEAIPDDEGSFLDHLPDFIEHGAEDLFELTALLSGESQEWVEDLDLVEFSNLVIDLIDLNRDFFIQRLPELMDRASQKLTPTTVGKSESSVQ